MPYDIYTKLFDAMIWPVISYGAAVWGTRKYSCIDAVQMKAQRFFLGTGKYTPSDAVAGDMGWVPTFIKQYKSICNEKRDNKQCLLDTPRRVTFNNKRLISKRKSQRKNIHIYIYVSHMALLRITKGNYSDNISP